MTAFRRGSHGPGRGVDSPLGDCLVPSVFVSSGKVSTSCSNGEKGKNVRKLRLRVVNVYCSVVGQQRPSLTRQPAWARRPLGWLADGRVGGIGIFS